MTYRVVFAARAEKQMKRIDRAALTRIVQWLRKNIDGSDNPRAYGKALTGALSGYWRYRVGNYRVVCAIRDDVCEVVAVQIGHRSGIYSQ